MHRYIFCTFLIIWQIFDFIYYQIFVCWFIELKSFPRSLCLSIGSLLGTTKKTENIFSRAGWSNLFDTIFNLNVKKHSTFLMYFPLFPRFKLHWSVHFYSIMIFYRTKQINWLCMYLRGLFKNKQDWGCNFSIFSYTCKI